MSGKCGKGAASMIDQIHQHFDAIFLGYMAALIAAGFTAILTKRHRLKRICTGVGLTLLAILLLYFAGLMLWILVLLITH
jgi:ABC-type uncharacterized transport system permease subunit